MNTENIWVVIPAFNEGEVLSDVVRGVTALGYSVVVVDDCSHDQTGSSALRAGAYVCRHVINLGQGAALQTGISYALRQGAKAIVTFDADGQHQAQEIQKILDPVLRGEVEVTLGSRFLPGGGAENMPEMKRVTLKFATWFTRMTSGLKLTDTHNGFRGLSRFAAESIHLHQDRMAHASEILSEIGRLKLSYREVPVTIKYTAYSVAKGQKISNSLNILWESAMELIRR